MPRGARVSLGGFVYHVLNRGNDRQDVFQNNGDYASFVQLMLEAHKRVPMRLVGYCLMTNHFHLLLWPFGDGDLSRWMQGLTTTHVRRYQRLYEGSGHVWQGRFKSFLIQENHHYFRALRYVERNPLRANLVRQSGDWEWSSLNPTDRSAPEGLLSDGPLLKPTDWNRIVNQAESEAELISLRKSVNKGVPFGDPDWQATLSEQ